MKLLAIFMAILICIGSLAVFTVTQQPELDFDSAFEGLEGLTEPYDPFEGFELPTEDDDFIKNPPAGENQNGVLEGTPVRSIDGLFQMTMPKGWEIAEPGELNEDASIELMNEKSVQFSLAIMEAKADFDTDLLGYGELIHSLLAETQESNLMGEISAQMVNGRQMYYYTLEMIDTGMRFYATTYIIETQNYYGQIVTWSTRSNTDWVVQNAPLFAASVTEV